MELTPKATMPRSMAVVRCVFQGLQGEHTNLERAIEAGACGYLLKDAPRAELFQAVRAAAAGQAAFTPAVAAALVRQVREPPADALTERELAVLGLGAQGMTNARIAESLCISEATVKTHLLHAFAKLGVADCTAAVMAALERGLLDRAPTRSRRPRT